LKEKHSPETKKRLNELKETVESSVQKAKDIDKLRQDITSQRTNEVQIFYRGITENEQNSETAIDELSIVRRLINLRLILTLVIFVVFLLIYNVFLTPIIGSFRWNLIAVPTLLLVLSYFIVNHLALRPVKELLSSKVDEWKKSLNRTQSKTYKAIEENERKGFLTKLNAEVSRFIHVTTSFVPMVRQVEEALEHQHLCYRIVDSILACLKRYNIKTNLLTKLEKQLKEKPPIRLSKEEITAEYLQRLAKKVKYPLLALKLLFYDFSGDTELCRLTWQQIKSDNESIENLLRFLHENNIISLEEIETARAVNLVNSLDDFSIQKLRWGLKSLRLIFELIEIVRDRAKREKLVERQIETRTR